MNPDQAFEEFQEPEAILFAKVLYRFIHTIDDLVDKDKTVPADVLGTVIVALFDQLANNPFFLADKADLLPLIYTSTMLWVASERFRASGNVQEEIAAEVAKSAYAQIFLRIAFLTRGQAFALDWMARNVTVSFG